MDNISRLSVVVAIIAVCCVALASAILIAPDGDDRFAAVLGLIAIAMPALVSQLKADQAASNTNGKLDARIQAAVHRANAARRRGDVPAQPDEIDGNGASGTESHPGG